MRKKLFVISAIAMMPLVGNSGVIVKLPDGAATSYLVEYELLPDGTSNSERPDVVSNSIPVVDGKLTFDITDKGAAEYAVVFGEREFATFYAEPGDNIVVDIKSLSPLDYSVSGTPLMDGIYEMKPKADAVLKEYRELSATGQMDDETMAGLQNRYNGVFKEYIKNNPAAPAALFALCRLSGEEFLEMFDTLPASQKGSALYGLVLRNKENEERSIEAEKKMKALTSGEVDAPGFTYKNLEGKDVNLADFRGKWVILDFWGGWCPWCIKGFPKLKEAYNEYQGKLEVIGIDCNESEDAWRKAVAKYELPWVNVYNPDRGGTSGVLADYGVQGFPTKVIINPEGKVSDITVGEDPSFFEKLDKLINGK